MYTTILTFECTFLHCWRRSHLFSCPTRGLPGVLVGGDPPFSASLRLGIYPVAIPLEVPAYHWSRSCPSSLVAPSVCLPPRLAGK